MLGPSFVMQYFVYFLVLLSSCLGRELIALLCLPDRCLITVSILCLSFTILWVGLQCVSVVFLGHTYFKKN